jgi:NADP-dependent 3-hydroxy acid dehydrogenase YdfG
MKDGVKMMLIPKRAIAGKVVIVTGASSGIGEATARAFAMAGATVVLAARRAERLERLAEEIFSAGGTALPVPTDLTDIDQIRNLVQTTLTAYGRIDVLANIAGWGRYDWLEELSPENLRMQYEVNVIGLAELTRQVLPVMKAQRSGHILNMSSYASRIAAPPLTVYASTKYAVEGLTDGLRRELIPWGIRVTRIHPSGVTGTEFNQKARQDGGIEFQSFPIGRVSREKVAQEMVKLVENPRRALFLSRLYDVPVVLNKLFPGLVDFLTSTWVRLKRREELQEPHPRPTQPVSYLSSPFGLIVAVLFFAVVLLFKYRHKG